VRCSFVIDAVKEGYSITHTTATIKGNDHAVDRKIPARTYIKWYVKNVNPFDQWDEIRYFSVRVDLVVMVL